MRCSCRACGTYMAQVEHGLESGCKCPDCGNMCRDCMGGGDAPLSVVELRARMASRLRGSAEDGFTEAFDPLEAMRPDPDTD